MKLTDAYNTELALLPVIIDMEKTGVRINPCIETESIEWHRQLDSATEYLSYQNNGHRPGTKAFNQALIKNGYIDANQLAYTEKGNPKFGRDELERLVSDENLKKLLVRRSKLQKALSTYIDPWHEAYTQNGRFYPYFNQVFGDEGGTRTGRMSSNLQQIPRKPNEDEDLPNLRKYIVPDMPGHVLLKRDFNGQELRVAAHYAEGKILDEYQRNPRLDVHQFVGELIKDKTGMKLDRVTIKTINFLKLYGGGPSKLALKLEIDESIARAFFEAYDKALPEFKNLSYMLERQVRSGVPLRTWGGRTYDVEPPVRVLGKLREFYYKLPNLLIQGSSADQTKHAMIRYFTHPDKNGRIVLQVHDELVVSCPEEHADEQMEILRWAMDDIPGWDTPMISDGQIGYNFGELEDYS